MLGDTSGVNRSEQGHFYLTGGYKFPLANDWMLEPSAFIKSSDMLLESIQADLTARVYYKEDYWLGVSYRTNDAVIMMAGLTVDRFLIGYAYDFTLSDIRTQTYGSHELTFLARFGDNPRRYRWINKY